MRSLGGCSLLYEDQHMSKISRLRASSDFVDSLPSPFCRMACLDFEALFALKGFVDMARPAMPSCVASLGAFLLSKGGVGGPRAHPN